MWTSNVYFVLWQGKVAGICPLRFQGENVFFLFGSNHICPSGLQPMTHTHTHTVRYTHRSCKNSATIVERLLMLTLRSLVWKEHLWTSKTSTHGLKAEKTSNSKIFFETGGIPLWTPTIQTSNCGINILPVNKTVEEIQDLWQNEDRWSALLVVCNQSFPIVFHCCHLLIVFVLSEKWDFTLGCFRLWNSLSPKNEICGLDHTKLRFSHDSVQDINRLLSPISVLLSAIDTHPPSSFFASFLSGLYVYLCVCCVSCQLLVIPASIHIILISVISSLCVFFVLYTQHKKVLVKLVFQQRSSVNATCNI